METCFNIVEYFNNIKNIIRQLGYEDSYININEAIELHRKYAYALNEDTFFYEILEVRPENALKAKKNNTKIRIMKRKDILSDKEIKNLKALLINEGYSNFKINKKQFLILYDLYGNGLTKRTFSIHVLGVKWSSFKNWDENRYFYILKNEDNNTKVNESLNISPQNIKKILKKNGYQYKSINYDEFLFLYNKYSYNLSEKDFALKVLNITIDSYKCLRLKGGNAIILKDEVINKEYNIIIKKLVSKKLINKAIDFEEFNYLYKTYGINLSEKNFALNVLQLTTDSYRKLIEKNNVYRFKILKNEIPKEMKKVNDYLRKNGWENKKITYSTLIELHKKYGHFISETKFAMLALDLTSSNYQNIQYLSRTNPNRTCTILPPRKITDKEIDNIRIKLYELGYDDKYCTTEELEDLYKIFGNGMSKRTFYEDVLRYYWHYENFKLHHITNIQKSDLLSREEIENLKEEIYSHYLFKRIPLDYILKLYEKNKDKLTFNTFIFEILGISPRQYTNAKSKKNYFIKVMDKNIKYTVEVIKNIELKEIRFYTKDEITNICKKYNITLENFILYLLQIKSLSNHTTYLNEYLDILNNYEKLWIGNNRVSNETLTEYYYQLENVIKRVINNIKFLYPTAFKVNEYINDDFQDLLLYFIENCSDIENNYMIYNNPLWQRFTYNRLRRVELIRVYRRIDIIKNETKTYFFDGDEEQDKIIVDKNENTEEEAIDNVDNVISKDFIIAFGELLLDGYTIEEASKEICEIFSLSFETFEKYMILFLKNKDINNLDLNILKRKIN